MSFHVSLEYLQTMHLPVGVVHMFKDEAWRLGEGIPNDIQKLHNVWPSAHLDDTRNDFPQRFPATISRNDTDPAMPAVPFSESKRHSVGF